MQTFLPYPTFQASAQCLDMRRLGKQRVECKQLLLGQFPSHPCAKMWHGYESALAEYMAAICREWIDRGYKDTCLAWLIDRPEYAAEWQAPPWLGDERVHSSHRANLMRKDPVHYGEFGWTEEPAEGYYWPV